MTKKIFLGQLNPLRKAAFMSLTKAMLTDTVIKNDQTGSFYVTLTQRKREVWGYNQRAPPRLPIVSSTQATILDQLDYPEKAMESH